MSQQKSKLKKCVKCRSDKVIFPPSNALGRENKNKKTRRIIISTFGKRDYAFNVLSEVNKSLTSKPNRKSVSKWAIPGPFSYFRLYKTVDSKCSFNIYANDWIRTEDLWNWKRPLNQLSHNHCPLLSLF